MRKSRAVLLGTNAYPFLMRYWYELFTKVWEDEVDKVYLAVSEAEHKSSWPYINALFSAHPKIEVRCTGTRWPLSINEVAKEIKEEIIFVPHDDTFIFKKGVLDNYFKIVEETGKVVTPITPIFNPKDLVEELMKKRYPDQVPFESPDGEIGYSFYCNMFFVPRELFRRTSMDFGEYYCPPGTHSDLLDYTPAVHAINSDTNFKLELELLREGAHFYAIPKSEISTLPNVENPLEELTKMLEEKRGNGWLHLQTMAYHIYGLYYDLGEKEDLEAIRGGVIPRKIENEQLNKNNPSYRKALTIRLAWIKEFMSVGDYSSVQRYYNHAKKELDYIIKYMNLDVKEINAFKSVFHNLIFENA